MPGSPRGAYRAHAGGQAPTGRVAIFLVYQPAGLQDTVPATCRHLAKAGYAVHVVANGGLAPGDRDRLLPLCARLVERPNHGHDFGGYRQELLACLEGGTRPERLLLLNDSIWFPALRECDLLDRLERLNVDVAGPVHVDHRAPRRAHLQSYMLLFSRRTLESPAFARFWSGYAMMNNKVRTVRHGEMRLTRACREAGLTVAALHDAYEAPDRSVLPPALRAEVAAYDAVRNGGPTDVAGVETGTHPAGTGRGGYLLSSHPAVLIGLLNFPILKKDRSMPYRRQRQVLRAPGGAALVRHLTPEVRAAVAAWDGPEAARGEGAAQATFTISTAKVRSWPARG
ncbi:hypothetical protein HKCCSP123_12520 [Rhodobacterales bacterium HKCCSP123]|nr:hypothetical protein [Rhodobacterales bacterium HKCCSP123]